MKKSELYQIIKEEIEVVLTNEEAEEMFDLDMSALLDEMMSEANWADEPEADRPWSYQPSSAGGYSAQVDRERPDTRKGRGGMRPRPGESDEEFFQRQADAVNKRLGKLKETELDEDEDKSFSKAAKEIEKKGTEGVFTAKAKKAGMGVQAYADKVLQKGSKASTKTKRQAAFAKGAATVARENK